MKVSGVRPGQWIAVYGAGGLGNLGVQYTKKVFGAHVVAIDINDEKLAFAKESGADLVINAAKEDAAKVIQEKTGGAHAAVVTAVSAAAFNSAVDCVRAGGLSKDKTKVVNTYTITVNVLVGSVQTPTTNVPVFDLENRSAGNA